MFFQILFIFKDNFKNIKVEDIRSLKSSIQRQFFNKRTFYIFDDIEFLISIVLNALLKIIEEPQSKNVLY